MLEIYLTQNIQDKLSGIGSSKLNIAGCAFASSSVTNLQATIVPIAQFSPVTGNALFSLKHCQNSNLNL